MMLNTLQQNYSLLEHNTFGLNVQSAYFLAYDSEDVLVNHLAQIRQLQLPILMVGEGSNLLFTQNYKGIVLHSQIKGYEITNEDESTVSVRVGGGVIWDDFVAWAVKHNFGGIENLSLIPGTVGASPVQNVGAYGVEAQDVIRSVEAIELSTGNKRVFTNEECLFEYRNSIFKHKLKGQYAVSHVTYLLSKKPSFNIEYGNIKELLDGRLPSLKLLRDVICEVRESKLPNHKELGNAGSFFKNPYISKEHFEKLKKEYPSIPHYPINKKEVKVPAGWLIDHANLKGFTHKDAAVHQNQALVLINKGNANGQNIVELAQMVISKVEELYDIRLQPEVNIL